MRFGKHRRILTHSLRIREWNHATETIKADQTVHRHTDGSLGGSKLARGLAPWCTVRKLAKIV
jgi:hypothetical protein